MRHAHVLQAHLARASLRESGEQRVNMVNVVLCVVHVCMCVCVCVCVCSCMHVGGHVCSESESVTAIETTVIRGLIWEKSSIHKLAGHSVRGLGQVFPTTKA